MMIRKSSEIYSYICHFIFAIIVAMSYSSAIDIFFNPDESFTKNFSSAIRGLELLFVYAFMISSWVGYSRAMLKWPHTDTKVGAFRFTLDIVILFCYFVLITFTQSQHSFEDHFLDFIIVIFTIFLVWDLLKTKEYWKLLDPNNTKKKTSISRYAMVISLGKTCLYLVLFVVIRFMYHRLNEYESELFLDSEMIYVLTLVLSIFFVLHYRYWKWRISPVPRDLKQTSRQKKIDDK